MTLPLRYRPALVAALLALALYAITLKGTFIEDDLIAIREDPRLYESGQWRRLLKEEYWAQGSVDNLYRPLVSLSFALQWHLIGDKPLPRPVPTTTQPAVSPVTADEHALPFHVVNWLMNAVVAAMVAELARRLTSPTAGNGPAYLAGILFAVHPIHVEAVAGLVGRAEMMCAIGIVGALILLLHRPITIPRVLAIVGCLAFAIFSKEQGMLLPLLMMLLPLSLGIDRPRSERERRAVMWLVLLVCWFTAAYIVIRERNFPFEWDTYFMDFSENPLVRCTPRDRLLMPLVLLGHYAKLLIFPLHLSPDYGGNVIGWVARFDDPYLYAGAAVAVAAIAILGALIVQSPKSDRTTRAALFCLLAAGALYGMVGNIVGLIGTNFGERLMYLPSIFLSIFVAVFLMRLPRTLMVALSVIAIVLVSIRTVTYAAQWNDRLRFYEIRSAEQPLSVRLHMLVAVESLTRGRFDEAKEADRLGRASLPTYTEVWIQSAQVAIARGEFDEAQRYLTHAWDIQPSVKISAWMGKVANARKAAATKPN
jgi:hypothetical protein